MTREETMGVIETEFQSVRQARMAGNEGMVRVCARRAAGAAIGYWLEVHDAPGRGRDAMSRLHFVAQSAEVPPPVRAAASRLTARLRPDFTSPHAGDPLDDARIIISHMLDGDPA